VSESSKSNVFRMKGRKENNSNDVIRYDVSPFVDFVWRLTWCLVEDGSLGKISTILSRRIAELGHDDAASGVPLAQRCFDSAEIIARLLSLSVQLDLLSGFDDGAAGQGEARHLSSVDVTLH